MKKILVTGGNGFIGTNLIIELVKDKNNQILNIDKFSYNSNLYLIKKKYKNFKNIKKNLLKFNEIKKIIFNFKPDLVFHLAAETHVDTSLTDPISHYNNNVNATINLISIITMALNKKKLKNNFKFIHVGTDEIYGDVSFKSKKIYNENQSLNPNNPYSASKAAAILAIKTWYKNYNFPCIITNSVNNFGPFQFVEKFIPRSIFLGLSEKKIEVYGKGKNIRSWISVHDHVKALIYLAKKGIVGESYNISSGYKLSNFVIAKKILLFLKKKRVDCKIKFVPDRLGHDRKYSISANKLQKLGWRSKSIFNKELKKTFNWYYDTKNLTNFKKIKKHIARKGMLV